MKESIEARLASAWQNLSSSARLRKNFQFLCALTLLGWMLFNWGQVGFVVVRDYVNAPVWDYWRVAQNYEHYRAHDLYILWQQHNEHRIVFPELVYAVDMLYLHGRQILPLVLTCSFYLGNWAVLAWAFVPARKDDASPCTIALLAAGIVIGSQASSQVLNTPFLLQWTLVQLTSLLGFFFVSKLGETSSSRYLAGAIGCVVVANYSSGNGLLLWPIVLLAAVAAGVRRGHVALLGLSAILSSGFYFVGYHFSKETNLLAIIHNPLYALGFLSSYLSMPFGHGVPAAGLLNFCSFCILLVLVARHRLWHARPIIVFFGSYLFTLGTIVITIAGRMDPADPTYTAAMAPRYVTVPLVNWAVLLLASLWISIRLEWSFIAWWKIIGTALLLFSMTVGQVHLWVAGEELNAMQQQAAVLSIESGLFVPDLIHRIFPDPNFVAVYLPILRRDQLALYSEIAPLWVGKDMSRTFRFAQAKLGTGATVKIVPLLGGIQVSGWVESVKNYRRLVFVDDHGRVVGLGKRNPAGIVPDLRPAGKRARLAWVGFINRDFASSQYRVFLVNDSDASPEITEIGAAFPLPPVTLQNPRLPGIALEPFQWTEHDGWIENTIPPKVEAGIAPSGSFLSSWNGSDQSTGIATSSLFAVARGCFVLPVLHGPIAERLTIRMLDQYGKQVAIVPLDATDTTWHFFRIITTEPQVRVKAMDSGSGFGEWGAIGAPRSCEQ